MQISVRSPLAAFTYQTIDLQLKRKAASNPKLLYQDSIDVQLRSLALLKPSTCACGSEMR